MLCVLYFDADQGLIGKIAHFYLKHMDFLRSKGSNMGGCCLLIVDHALRAMTGNHALHTSGTVQRDLSST